MEPATFRPPMRALGAPMLMGALAGAAVGVLFEVPLSIAAIFGAVAAAIVLSAQHARGLRVIADERGVRAVGAAPLLDGAWSELRLGFGIAQREDGRLQRYAILADARGRSFAFG